MQTDRQITLTESQLRDIVTEGVDEALTRLGVDAKNPMEMQKDFQHLRDWRQATQAIEKRGLLGIVGILISGLAALIWIGFTKVMNGS